MSMQPNFFVEPHILSGLDRQESILLGLSGGADSSALLHLLCLYRERTGCEIFAAHLNHGIRGSEADRDERFCKDICDALSVKLFVKHLDIPAMAKASGESLETEARNARYEFFSEVMNNNHVKILATAHNADDNLETQISNLARGCGIAGMIGIPQKRVLDGGGVVIRPILSAEKSEIITYCTEKNINFVTDSTNFETDCTRNAIRHKIIPELLNLFPSAKKNAMRLSNSAKEDLDFIIDEARSFLERNNRKLNAAELNKLHPALAKRVIILAFAEISDATLEEIHLTNILSLAKMKKNGASVSLPNRKRTSIIDGILHFYDDTRDKNEELQYRQELSNGMNTVQNTPFCVFIGKSEPHLTDGYIPYAHAKVKTPTETLYASNRCAGASILDGGVNKKIKKLMCDKKVPLLDRNLLPIIYLNEDAIYVPLCAVSDTARAEKKDKNSLYIGIYKTEGIHE